MKNRSFLCTLAGVFCVATSVFAQVDTGTITGTVADPSGAILPAASVTLTHEESKISRTVLTNEVGYYVAPNLHAGSYSIKVELAGFKSWPFVWVGWRPVAALAIIYWDIEADVAHFLFQ